MVGTVHGFEHEAVEELVVWEDAFRGDDFLAGAFVDAVGEPLGNGVETVEDFCAGAAGVGALLELVVFDDGTELTIFVVGEVAAGFVEGEFADVRGEDLAVALAGEFGADEVLEFLADDGAFGGPEDEALADVVVDVEELEFAAEFPVDSKRTADWPELAKFALSTVAPLSGVAPAPSNVSSTAGISLSAEKVMKFCFGSKTCPSF